MGIPFLYSFLVKKNAKIVVNMPRKKCSHLYLDFNSIIHQSVNILKNNVKGPTHLTNESIFLKIVDYTNFIVESCKPEKTVVIAIDGVAPLAKQQQQRKRRYLSASNNREINAFKKKQGIPFVDWDSNQITPGTEFMQELNNFLHLHYSQKKTVNYVISGSDEPDEGEHKIFKIMSQFDNDGCDVIFGLDADLIMLSLIQHKRVIYLMRESEAFDDLTDHQGFKYLDIPELRSTLPQYMSHNPDLDDNAKIQLVNDYIVMCFLVGNDFLPNINILKIKFNSINMLCNIYRDIQEISNEYLVIQKNNGLFTLNQNMFLSIIEKLSDKEDEMLTYITEEYNKTNRKYNNNRGGGGGGIHNLLNQFMSNLDSYPLHNKMTHLIDVKHNKNWRDDYYHILFDSDHSASLIKSVCLSYIKGIHWTIDYYFNRSTKTTSFYYVYEHNFSPCLSDIRKYLTIMSMGGIHMEKDKKELNSIDINQRDLQLLYVMPPDSIDVMPKHLHKYVKDVKYGLCHYFPIYFKVHTYLKYHGWECIPVLPFVNYNHMYSVLYPLKNN